MKTKIILLVLVAITFLYGQVKRLNIWDVSFYDGNRISIIKDNNTGCEYLLVRRDTTSSALVLENLLQTCKDGK